MTGNLRRGLAYAIAFFVWVALPTVASARGGGGSHSSGGSSSGSGGGSGGGYVGGGGGGVYYYNSGGSGGVAPSSGFGILMVCISLAVIVAIIYVIARLVKWSRNRGMAQRPVYASSTPYTGGAPVGSPVNVPPAGNTSYMPTPVPLGAPSALSPMSTPMPALPTSPMGDQTLGIAAIAAADPGFNQHQFLDRCQAAFMLLQKAWMDRNVDEGRAYMSSGLYQTWSMQVQQMTAAHKHNVMEDLFIQGMNVVKAGHDQNFDTITVRVDASCKDYEVDDQSGKVVFGDNKHDKPFTEFWTFQRSAGAKTLVGGGVTDKQCPNCGAPLNVNQNGSCTYCNAPVTSGKFDWVLSRIDQDNQWMG